jgi:hypothetical protein
MMFLIEFLKVELKKIKYNGNGILFVESQSIAVLDHYIQFIIKNIIYAEMTKKIQYKNTFNDVLK